MGMRVGPELERKCLELAGLLPAPVVTIDEDASEKAFQADVVKFAKRCGWAVYHTHDSRKSEAGFPDLVLVRDRVAWVELKTRTGELTSDQAEWIRRLTAAGGTVYIWRPADWPKIEEVLR